MTTSKAKIKLKDEELRYELTKLIKRYGKAKVMEAFFNAGINPYPELKPKKITSIGRWG